MSNSAVLDLDGSTTIDMTGAMQGASGSGSDTDALVFKNYSRTESQSKPILPISASPGFSGMGDDQSPDDEEDNALMAKSKPPPSVFEFAFFAQYFNVTSSDVLSRIMCSVIPISHKNGSYIERHIRFNPDIYGPLWVNFTLIFSIAVCGNIANYLSSGGDAGTWHNDWNKLGLAASTVFSYTTIVPVLLWLFFWFRNCSFTYTLLETVCAYGYSLSVYIPISLLWIIHVRVVQYLLVIVGALLSGLVLTISFAPVVSSDPSTTFKTSYFILLVIIGLHALVAFSFLFYFF